ncbi:hypothetical protein [Clostridium perfringens]|nr:hypothetical protein [Clostridium perfringens]
MKKRKINILLGSLAISTILSIGLSIPMISDSLYQLVCSFYCVKK